jgi:deoxyribonuclease V
MPIDDSKIPDPWPTTAQDAILLQRQLSHRVIVAEQISEVHLIAGTDVGFETKGTITRAAVVVLKWPDLTLLEQHLVKTPTRFPYVPGLLSFREVPALLQAFDKLTVMPDLILCDGQGMAHPRRFGLACHLGILLNCPTIGVAKSRLVGTHGVVPEERGGWTPLCDRRETIGAVLRNRAKVKPLYISTGHRVTLESAIAWVINCTTRYRLPEPTRLADKLASSRK